MTFVNEDDGVRRQIFKQRRRRRSGRTSGQVARIVFDAFTMAGRFEHFEIETGALFQPLSFEQFVLAFQFVQPFAEFFLYVHNRLRQSRRGVT